ncbi:MAG TPA: MHYT domain-containing protein [Thermoanaerobaculia bacterium]|nr:MHYT domain-containing protein [Thermoanaerobaculia bacterium]
MEHVEAHYDYLLVALSYVTSVLGAFTALRLLRQEAGAMGSEKWRSLVAGALAMGGGAIWSMHFIGMLAYKMGMPVEYDIPLTLASLIVAVLVTGFGLYVVGQGPKQPGRLVLGGTVMGAGVASMHYTGMAAMRMQGTLTYDTALVSISVAIAVVASIAALWLVFHAVKMWHMIASALVMGIAVCGMHYTGMVAATMKHDPTLAVPKASGLSPEILAYIIFLVTIVILSGSWLAVGSSRAARIQRTA